MSRSVRPHRPPPTLPKLSRTKAQIPLHTLLIVCCEGQTEKSYFDWYARTYRTASIVEVRVTGACGVPSTVVERAILARDAAVRAVRGEARLPSVRIQTWAVVDRDEHPPAVLGRARDLAASNAVGFVLSNPCFELWAVLHLSEQAAWIHRHDCQRLLHNLMPKYHHDSCPYLDTDLLRGRDREAERRARLLDERHLESATVDPNPSTAVWMLCGEIRGSDVATTSVPGSG